MKILCIGDIHEPVAHPMYMRFCLDMYRKWKCNTVVIIGDIADNHAISFHAKHPDCPGPSDEYELTKAKIQQWYKVFPKAYVTIGNHDARHIRLAESVMIPSKFLRDYQTIWETPGWHWVNEIVLDDVFYYHGDGCGGLHPAYNAARSRLMSTVIGHAHSAAGIKWMAGPNTRIFSMDSGCGIDQEAWQFAYGRHMPRKPILGCGVVIDGVPYYEIMPCATKERYNRKKASKKQ